MGAANVEYPRNPSSRVSSPAAASRSLISSAAARSASLVGRLGPISSARRLTHSSAESRSTALSLVARSTGRA
jgi:hypothetical protein